MYKKQLRFQKFVCLFCIIAAGISFVYALGIITDIYDSLYPTMMNPNDPTETMVPGSIIYYDMQNFNKLYVNASIGLILLGCLLFLTNTNSRRKYYIGNYVATALYALASLALVVWSHVQISAFKVQYLTTVDFEALQSFSQMWNTTYTTSTFWLDVHYVVAVISVLAVAALVVNCVWKIQLMRGENELLAARKEAVG